MATKHINRFVIQRFVHKKAQRAHFMIFNPQRFLKLGSIESDQVDTKGRFARSSNHMDSKDGPFAASERAIICHINPAPYWEYVLVQDM